VTQLGFGFVNNFVFYFIHDVSPHPYRLFGLEFTSTNDAVGIFTGALMLTAGTSGLQDCCSNSSNRRSLRYPPPQLVFSGYAGGALGDRLGRKRMVYVSSAFQTLSCTSLF
jgi:MFS family permease